MNYPNARGMLITRDAYEPLKTLKKLVDDAETKLRVAERETAEVAIGHRKADDPLRTLRDVADTLQSPNFEAAVSFVQEKTQVTVEWHANSEN